MSKVRAREHPRSDRLVVREVAHLLRSGCDSRTLHASDTGRKLLRICGSAVEAVKWLDRAIASLRPISPLGIKGRRLARQSAIVARYDRARESSTTIAQDLAISSRLFYRERSSALLRLAALIAESDSQRRMKLATHQPFETALAEVDAHDEAGDTEHALSRLQALLSSVGTPMQRLEVLSRMIVPLARGRRMAAAYRVAAAARHCLAATDLAARADVEGRLLLAELRQMQLQRDPIGSERAFTAIRRKVTGPALAGDPGAIRTLTAAFLDHAMNRVDFGDSHAAEEFLHEAEVFAARILDLPLAAQIQMSIVKLGVHVDQPQHFARAPREAAEAYRLAKEHGLARLATQALYQFTSIALISRKPHFAMRCGKTLLKRARLSNDGECFIRANFALAGGDYLFGHYDAALKRLNAMKTPATGGSIGDVLVDALRARVLFGLGHFDLALKTIEAVRLQASEKRMEQAAALALLLKTRIALRLNDVRSARSDISAGLELLSRYPTPLQLVRAYRQAFQLTAHKRYRDDADDLWRMIAPAFVECDDLIPLDLEEDISSPQLQVDHVTSTLTRRERTIAVLVSAGKTNREVAECLGLSVRTVEQHVQSILRRLNVDHRWQIGAPALEFLADIQ